MDIVIQRPEAVGGHIYGEVYFYFLYFDADFLVVLPACSAETYLWWGRKLNGYLIASCVRNIGTKSYKILLMLIHVTVHNVCVRVLGHSIYICIMIITLCVLQHYSVVYLNRGH